MTGFEAPGFLIPIVIAWGILSFLGSLLVNALQGLP
jgi:hypothetical protein